MHWRRKLQPTPVFLPGESQGRGSLVGCHLWGLTETQLKQVSSSSSDFLVIQQRVFQPPYVGIFNRFSPVIEIKFYCLVGRKDTWHDFNFFWIYQGLIYGPGCDLSWRRFRVRLSKRWNSLFWGEMSYRYQLGLTGLLYHLKFVSLLIFCLVDLSIGVSGVVKSPTIIVLLLISPFILVSIVLHIAVLLSWVHI